MKERNLGTVLSVVMHLCLMSLMMIPAFPVQHKPPNVVTVHFSDRGDSAGKSSTPDGDTARNRKRPLKSEKATKGTVGSDRPIRENPSSVRAAARGEPVFAGAEANFILDAEPANAHPAGSGYAVSAAGSREAGGQEKGGPAAESEDYRYIRDAVMRNVRYPDRARRLGLEGKVVVSFIVQEDGTTSEIRLLGSSTHRILDQSAKEAVASVRIAKKVASRIVVRLPIVYKLQKEPDDLT